MARQLALALALTLAGCSSDDDDSGSPQPSALPTTVVTLPDPTSTTTPPTTAAQRTNEVRLRPVGTFDQPTVLAWNGDGSRGFVAERPGRLWLVRRDGDRLVKSGAEPALDLSDRVESGGQEQGLLGVAVTPDGQGIVLDFIERGGTAGTSVLEHYDLDGDGRPVPSTRSELLRLDQPFRNHNGGEVAFGRDGMLYVAFGDGGSGNDPRDLAQDRSVLLGKILRLALSDGRVSVPSDNPFVGEPGMRPEIWLYGVRNPWRFSFDTNGDLWIGDVGQGSREEIDHLAATAGRDAGKGANLGWSAREGTVDTGLGHRVQGSPPVDPVHDYGRDDGCSVTGGFVYRGSKWPGLVGDYLFSDYCAGTIRALDGNGRVRSLQAGADSPSSFSLSPTGELYVLSLGGEISEIEAA